MSNPELEEMTAYKEAVQMIRNFATNQIAQPCTNMQKVFTENTQIQQRHVKEMKEAEDLATRQYD